MRQCLKVPLCFTVLFISIRVLYMYLGKDIPEPEFLNIYWRLKSRLFEESCLFKGQSVQQGSQWLKFVCVVF